MNKTYAYNCKVTANCLLVVYVNIKDKDDIVKFEISQYENKFKQCIKFLGEIHKDHTIVSFNGLNFDSQVIMYLIKSTDTLINLTGGEIARKVFAFVEKLMKVKNEQGYTLYKINELPFKEIDIAAINNYNSNQKFASLKWVQYNMDWYNIMDTKHNSKTPLNMKEIIQLSTYSINDCMSIIKLLALNKKVIKAREDLSKHFNLPLQNLSEPKLVKAIMLDLLSKDMGIDASELKNMQTYRKHIYLGEVILKYITFSTRPLKDTLAKFSSLKLDANNLKGSFKHKVTYRGLEFSFALGGIHGAKRGSYKEGDQMVIKTFDAKSYYPKLMIKNKWSPAHIPSEVFCQRFEWFYNERIKYSKTDPINYLFKIILNAGVGLSNEKNSFLRDSFLTMQITCNGQLLLVQLMEKLCEQIPGTRPIMVNTDGGEVVFPKEHEPLYDKICAEWEKMTSLELEHDNYHKLIIWDVNNFIGIFNPVEIDRDKAKEMFEKSYPKPLIKKVESKFYHYPVKLKGRFEIDKEYHKNKSYRIKAIAIYNYFVHGIAPEKTVYACKNIYDFCAGIRARGKWAILENSIVNGENKSEVIQRTVRYYVSQIGSKLIRESQKVIEEDVDIIDSKGRVQKSYVKGDIVIKEIKVEASKSMEKVLMKIDSNKKFEDYNIDIPYYLKMIKKEIEKVEPLITQKLF